ncbi:SbcC/MukB-like Walker B domain-containing protein [Nocardiopsis coralliicola]
MSDATTGQSLPEEPETAPIPVVGGALPAEDAGRHAPDAAGGAPSNGAAAPHSAPTADRSAPGDVLAGPPLTPRGSLLRPAQAPGPAAVPQDSASGGAGSPPAGGPRPAAEPGTGNGQYTAAQSPHDAFGPRQAPRTPTGPQPAADASAGGSDTGAREAFGGPGSAAAAPSPESGSAAPPRPGSQDAPGSGAAGAVPDSAAQPAAETIRGTEAEQEPGSGGAPAAETADAADAPRRNRHRLHRAGIHNVWQYDDQVFRFADGRLLLRGRNGAGKSKALEVLLPFLLDGDARRLDTTGTGRTGFRWLMADGMASAETAAEPGTGTGRAPEDPATGAEAAESAGEEPGGDDGPEADTARARLGYLWVEFAKDGGDDPVTLGAAISAADPAGGAEPRCAFFLTRRRIGDGLDLLPGGRPLPVERLRAEVGPENCFDSAAAYRARVMRDLFGLDDPQRYRNLIHLLYRLRRPTIGDRLEAGELVSVLAEALPPMDEAVLDQVARNVADLEEARDRLTALRTARGAVGGFLGDYRGYLHRVIAARAAAARDRLGAHARRDAEAQRLAAELDALVTAEAAAQEERDRARRTRDTAGADAATLEAAGGAPAAATDHELQARHAAVTAYIRAAEASWTAAGYALSAEERGKEALADSIATAQAAVADLAGLLGEAEEAARAGGLEAAGAGDVPRPVQTVLAPRESVTHVDFEGLERAVERAPVPGLDEEDLRTGLSALHRRLAADDEAGAERAVRVALLRGAAADLAAAERRSELLRGEEEAADAVLERARERERAAVGTVRERSGGYAEQVRAWVADVRAAHPGIGLNAEAAAVEALVDLPLDDALRVLDTATGDRVAEAARAMVDPVLREERSRRDTAVGEERELVTELDELSDRKGAEAARTAPAPPPWATAERDPSAGAPLYLLVDFASGLTAGERAGLEGALEASGLLNAWVSADGTARSDTGDVIAQPGRAADGRNLADVLTADHAADALDGGPAGEPSAPVGRDRVEALLAAVALLPPEGARDAEPRHRRRRDGEAAAPACAVALDGRWRLGPLCGAHRKAAAEHIGAAARKGARDRFLANVDRRIDIADALLAEAGERRAEAERGQERAMELARTLPSPVPLAAAWAALDEARSGLAAATGEHRRARDAAEAARTAARSLRTALDEEARAAQLPVDAAALDATAAALDRFRVRAAAAFADLQALAADLAALRRDTEHWRRTRADRVAAEDARTAAIGDMITVRRDIELTDRARAADPERIAGAAGEVRERMAEAADRLPELERTARQARDERIAAESRLGTAVTERAEEARRAVEAGSALCAALTLPDGTPDADLLAAAGLDGCAGLVAAAAADVPEAAAADTGAEADSEDAAEAAGTGSGDAQDAPAPGEEPEQAEPGPEGGAASAADAAALADGSAARIAALEALTTALEDAIGAADAAEEAPAAESAGGTADAAEEGEAGQARQQGSQTEAGSGTPEGGPAAAAEGAALAEAAGAAEAAPPPAAQPGPDGGTGTGAAAGGAAGSAAGGGDGDGVLDDSGVLRRGDALHRALVGSVAARAELSERAGVKRVTVHDAAGAHDITDYAARLDTAAAAAEESALLREEEAYERHLLGDLAGHLSRQIDEASTLVASMNGVLAEVTTSQGLGVRIDWDLAPDADEDIRSVVPLLARPPEQRTRLETTRLRDALRRCIESIRRLDPTATGGAQLRAALDYRSWFAFTVHVTDAAHPDRPRRLSHRTGLSQGEQRVVAYLVLFAAAAAQFDALGERAPEAPRLILLDDAFAKVDEPTHGRLLGLLVELDLDFVLTSERVWGCFSVVPGLHIYECLRDPAVPGIATLHFSWDGARRRLLGV